MAKQSNEGGIQDACNDTCCICLEDYSRGRVSTVTNCNHQYHLQCIIEWCQRSSDCPTCRQPVSLKEQDSQYLLEAVEEERKMKAEEFRNAAAQITPAQIDIPSRRRASEADVHEQLRQYMINMGRRYQFSTTEASGNSIGESSAGEQDSSASFTAQFSSISTRYTESILRSTRGWKERLLSRSNSMS